MTLTSASTGPGTNLTVTQPAQETSPSTTHDRRMLEALVCPRTQGTLRYDAERQELISENARLAFPIRDGIPIMLVSEARALD